MSSNRARKSTGPQTRNQTPNNRGRRRLFNSNNSQNSSSQLGQISSESEEETQRLRPQNKNGNNNQSLPGPSGLSLQATQASSDSDIDSNMSTLRLSNQRRQNNRRNQQEQSTSETTSDSDEVPGQERVRENQVNKKKKKVTKPRPTPAKAKRSIRKRNSDSDYEEDTQRQSSINLLSPSQKRNLAKLVNDCVYFLLIADQKKHAIKRQDIIKHVFVNQDNKLYNAVIEEANKVLNKTYGMEILVSEKRKGEYMLINCLDRDLNIQEFCDISPSELQKRGLIFYLLTVIFMNENSINEDDLCEALKPLGIDINSRTPHPIFGDVRKYLTTELVKQMYLEYRCLSKDPPQFEFSWGIRAVQEVDKKDLLEFACRIMNDTTPEEWILQYKDAMDSAREPAENSTRSRN